MTGFILAALRSALFVASIVVLTWNAKWFPSGRADHRASPEKEAATIKAAGAHLKEALSAADPAGTNDVILVLNEILNREAAEALVNELGRTNLVVSTVSVYRRRNAKRERIDMQQDVIATTLPIAKHYFCHWLLAKDKASTPPRGYACAELLVEPAVTARVYAVHLKSNYGAKTDEDYARNRDKRSHGINEILQIEKLPKSAKKRNSAMPVIIAGDFNADKWNDEFAQETIFDELEKAEFVNPLELLPKDERVTYPGYGKWKNRSYDYIMTRDFEVKSKPAIISCEDVSDHNAVVVELEIGAR